MKVQPSFSSISTTDFALEEQVANREVNWEIDFLNHPSSLHLLSLEQCFLCSFVHAATPVVTLASKRILGLVGGQKLLACPRPGLEPKGQLDGCGCDWR